MITDKGWKNGDLADYDNGTIKGRGIVRGIAMTPQPGIGAIMIVEDIRGNLPTKEYPFTHFAIPEVNLTKVD